MEENNNNNNTPSTSSDVMPSGGSNIGQAAAQGAKKAARKGWNSIKDGVGRGLKALWSLLPTTVKIVAIVILFIFIIMAALLMMGMISESTSVASSNVDDYIADATDLDEEAKSLYDEKSSLIKLKLSDINKVYDKLVNDDKGGSETQTLMQYKIGTNDVAQDKETNRIVSVDDKLPLYKHILLTEKYNFNSIKWQKFSHNATAGNKVETFKEDKEVGLKYPDDSKNEAGGDNPNPTKLEKFIDLTLPYLQTWYIPLSMSNASVISGTEEDSSRAPAFSYNIIKEAYSNIIVNWYELKKHTTVTMYHTYDRVERHNVLYNVVVSETQKRSSTDALSYETVGYSIDSNNINPAVLEDSRTAHNTSTNNGLANGIKDPMKEDLIKQNDEYTSHYYVKEADVFDAKIINEFNYQVYSDSDANKRINADSTNETSATWTKTGDNMENKYDSSSVSCDNNGNPTFNGGKASTSSKLVKTETVSNIPGQSDEYRVIKRTYTVTLGKYYEYENGLEHTVTRIWKDKLSQSGSETSDYTIDDLILYNQSEDRKETVSGMDLCGTSYSSSASSSATSTGTSAPATEIKVGSYTYPVFNQGSYGQTSHGGQTIAQAGCGLCSLTTVVGGITGNNVDPVSCGNDTNWTGPKTLQQIANDLKNVYGINTEVTRWDNKNSGPSYSEKIQTSKTKIKEALNNNNPVIALIKPNEAVLGTSANGAHYITLVGMNGDNVIIANSAGGKKEEYNIDFVIENIYVGANSTECGFVVAKRSGGSSSTSTSSSSSSSSNTLKGTGQAKTTSSNVNSTGYTGIFTSGTTGRSFKEYKQNGNTFIDKYDISSVGCSWSGECGTVSTIIIGSGYSNNATFADATSKLKANGGGTTFVPWLSDYAKDAEVKEIDSPSQSQLKNLLSDGCVAVVHDPGYSVDGHYMAILDISADKTQIYVSNPDSYNNIQNGWNPISVFYTGGQYLTNCYFVSNNGSVAQYSNDESSSSSSGTSDTTCTGTESGKYYTNLKNTDGLNRIDFMNSNPDIFHRYIREGAEYYEYVGYSRSKLTLSYWNLKKMLQEVSEKNSGTLPWAYGKTLGFDNIYNSSSTSSGSVAGGGRFIWPIPEYVEAGLGLYNQLTSTFGTRTNPITGAAGQNHSGIDISASVNTSAKIVAAASGTVMKASDSGDGYGVCVIIQHSDGYYTLYGHMATGSLKVNVGDTVNSGQQIGVMGTTGNSTGNHLHFEVIKFDGEFSMAKIYGPGHVNCLDPIDFFNDDCSPIGGTGNGEFLFTSGYTADSNYKGQTYSLTSEERSELQWIIYNEYGSGGYEAMVLQAQCLRDALVSNYNNCTPMNIKNSLGYAYGEYGNSKSVTDNSEEAKKALEYVFDQGGSAVQHRILLMCTEDYYNSGGWHYQASTGNGSPKTIEKIYQFGTVIYFDVL